MKVWQLSWPQAARLDILFVLPSVKNLAKIQLPLSGSTSVGKSEISLPMRQFVPSRAPVGATNHSADAILLMRSSIDLTGLTNLSGLKGNP